GALTCRRASDILPGIAKTPVLSSLHVPFRKRDVEPRAPVCIAHRHGATEPSDDAAADRQPDSCANSGWSGREEWIEDSRQRRRFDAACSILRHQTDRAGRMAAGGDTNTPAANVALMFGQAESIAGVKEQVHDHLLELRLTGAYSRQVIRDLDVQAD